jgi:cysteine-rich repeat protein
MGPDDCRNRDLDLKLVPGSIYEIAIFHADRHPTESNYQLTLSGFTTTRSVCQPRCGDGIVSAGEECDDGDKNNDTLYGGCTTKCKLGPFCGDGNKDEGEACDLGRDNGVQADGTVKCTEACKLPQRCGDGVVDSNEECDMGQDNGQPGKRCTSACRLEIL